MKKKNAFTLAEVLITLGIIGIVAAMTLPVLVGHYKKKEYYWTHTNGAHADENGNAVYDPVKGPKYTYEFIMKYIVPYIKYTRIEQSVIPDYTGETMVAIYFADGSIAYTKSAGCIDFNLDVNGTNKPNKMGYDTFTFVICPWSSSYYFDHNLKKWGTLCDNPSRNDREALIQAKKCPSRILELSNWEFTDDYPFKF